LADKRVGVIGTGATAVQCVPPVAAAAEHLYVFQRTPSSISERGNAPTDPVWSASLRSGWHHERMTNFNRLVSGIPEEVDLVGDKWTSLASNIAALIAGKPADGLSQEEIAEAAELADFATMEELRRRIDEMVDDPATAEALKPYYRMFCKRPCFSDDYLPTFNRPNVTLVDTQGRGVERFTERGPVVDGTEFELDCVIFATGFDVGTPYTRRSGFDIIGRGGVRLSQAWADGPSTFHGFYTNGFPNMFHLGITQSGLTINFPHCLNEQARHVAHVVQHCEKRGASTVEPTPQAETEWVATMRRLSQLNQSFLQECTPGYYNQEGRPGDGHSYFSAQYGEGSEAFFALLRQWREDDRFKGLAIT
jgi:cyclohexanone monooxygenase